MLEGRLGTWSKSGLQVILLNAILLKNRPCTNCLKCFKQYGHHFKQYGHQFKQYGHHFKLEGGIRSKE